VVLDTASSAVAVAGESVGYGTWGQIQIGAGIAHLRAAELEGAAEMFGPVLGLPLDRRLATLTGRLESVTPMLRAPAHRRGRTAALPGGQVAAVDG
jgi:hypothetical protein